MAKIVDFSKPTITITLVGEECYGLGELLNCGVSAKTINTLSLASLLEEMQRLYFCDAKHPFEHIAHVITPIG
jgi:hypothetical protein